MVIKHWFLWRIFHDYFPKTLQFFGFINTLLEGLTRVHKHFLRNEKNIFYLCQVSTGHYEKYFNIFLRSVLVRTPCKPHFCSLHELHVLCISRDKINPHWASTPRGEPRPHRWEASALPLTPFMLPNKIGCFRSRFFSDSVVKTTLSASVSDTLTERRSFRPKVDSPDDVHQDIGRFAWWHTTLYHMVKMPLEQETIKGTERASPIYTLFHK